MKTSIDFQEIALSMVARRIPVIPLQRYYEKDKNGENIGKGTATAHGASDATLDPAVIEYWASQCSDMNAGAVARPENPDGQPGIWILDDDRGDIVERYGADIIPFPSTLTVRSSGQKRHYYFRQSAASIKMGNQMYDKNPKLGFSARVNNLYVVAPGSIHPLTKQPYEIVKDVEIVPAPDDLIAWLQAEITKAEGSKPKTEESRVSDAEIEHQRIQLKRYLAFGGFDILKENFENGRWTIMLDPNQCPFGGHRPGEGSVAVFVNVDGAFGFKCIHCTPEHEWANPNNHNEDFHWEHFRVRVDRSRLGKIFSGFKKFEPPKPEEKTQDQILQDAQAFRDGIEFFNTMPEDTDTPYIVQKLIPKGDITLITAGFGEGKTLLAGLLADAISEGKPFADRKVEKHSVLFLDRDNGKKTIQKRRLLIPGLKTKDNVGIAGLWTKTSAPEFTDPGLKAYCAVYKPVVIVDVLTHFRNGARENEEAMAQRLLELRELISAGAVAVIVLHHVAKYGKGQGADWRGHTSIPAGVSAAFNLEKNEHNVLTVRCFKMRDDEKPADLYLGLIFDKDTGLTYKVVPPPDLETERGADRMERIAEYVKKKPNCSKNDVYKSQKGNKQKLFETIKHMVLQKRLKNVGTEENPKLVVNGLVVPIKPQHGYREDPDEEESRRDRDDEDRS